MIGRPCVCARVCVCRYVATARTSSHQWWLGLPTLALFYFVG
eukprot:COSAG01_NODE_1805_length_9192_cov_13.807324_5_plen_42_part_00